MGYALRDGTTFAITANRPVFLDVANDRYFCLQPDAEATFRRVMEGSESLGDGDRLRDWTRSGLLAIEDRDGGPVPCLLPAAPETSILDMPSLGGSAALVMLAAASLVAARTSLAARGMAPPLARLARRKRRLVGAHPRPCHDEHVVSTAAAFDRLSLFMSPLDLCLPRSIALAARCLSRGAPVDLVVAVKLDPFGAHAWIQFGPKLLNERVDVARQFTPVLVV